MHGSSKTPTVAEGIELGVDGRYNRKMRSTLKRHERMWNERLERTCVVEHIIDFVRARPFRSPPYVTGPENRELKSVRD